MQSDIVPQTSLVGLMAAVFSTLWAIEVAGRHKNALNGDKPTVKPSRGKVWLEVPYSSLGENEFVSLTKIMVKIYTPNPENHAENTTETADQNRQTQSVRGVVAGDSEFVELVKRRLGVS